jgi:hypothetical protein
MLIPARFNGPPGTGNGGYSAGLFAGGDRREVTLLRPPPLDTPLSTSDGHILSPDGEVVAVVVPVDGVEDAVPPVGYGDSVAASAGYPGFADHPFPGCYVCGPDREDGLRIFPGPTAEGTTAAPWTVPDGVSPAVVWAALDCPGGWAVITEGRPYVLGRIAAQVRRVPLPGERCVVVGALASAGGRTARVHTTLYGPDGAELARARATWVAVRSG